MNTREAPSTSPLDDELRAALHERDVQNLQRRLRSLPADVLDLASNDYLGLSRHPLVIEAAQDALAKWGSGARASRLVSGHTSLHQELEADLAAFKGCEAALVFSSGYAANISTVTTLARVGDFVFCDKRNHASLIDACRLAGANGAQVRYYGSTDRLRALLQQSSTRDAGTANPRRLLISDAVYSMDGDIVDLPHLLALACEFDATIILDDAHGLGTLGPSGCGAVEHFGLSDTRRVVHVGTLSKSLASQGGFVAGSQVLVDWLVNAARPFIYSTGLAPAACAAALAALRVLRTEPQRVACLREVALALVEGLRNSGFDVRHHGTPILPVIMGEPQAALQCSAMLLENGVWCPAIRPPTVPAGSSRLRVTALAALTKAEIDRTLQVFAHVHNEYSSKGTT